MQRVKNFYYLIGLSLEEAQAIHANLRVVRQDDEDFMVTQEVDETRLNVEVEKGKISAVNNFG